MPRIRTNKQYAISLVHNDLGNFYFNYLNDGGYNGDYKKYMFTKNLNKVHKWKTLSVVEEYIEELVSNLKFNKNKISIQFEKTIPNVPIEYESKIENYRGRYYLDINKITSKNIIDKSKTVLENLDETLEMDSFFIYNKIKNCSHTEIDDFDKIIKKLANDIKKYQYNYKRLEENKKMLDNCYLDIVDASYNFRTLKLRNLKSLQ